MLHHAIPMPAIMLCISFNDLRLHEIMPLVSMASRSEQIRMGSHFVAEISSCSLWSHQEHHKSSFHWFFTRSFASPSRRLLCSGFLCSRISSCKEASLSHSLTLSCCKVKEAKNMLLKSVNNNLAWMGFLGWNYRIMEWKSEQKNSSSCGWILIMFYCNSNEFWFTFQGSKLQNTWSVQFFRPI